MTNTARAPRAPLPLRALAAVASILLAGPAAYLIIRNFTSDADPIGLLFSEQTRGPLWRTVKLATLVSLSSGVIGVGLAWLTSRTDLPMRKTFRILLTLPLVYPTFLGAAALVRTLNPGGLINNALTTVGIDRTPTLGGLWGAWLVLTMFTYPYVYLPVAARFSKLPGSIEQSARLLGNSAFHVFRRIILPQASGSIAAGMLLVFLYAISDFGAVSILRYDTLTRAIEANQLNRPVALALSLLLLVIAGIVVLAERAAQRRRRPGTTIRSDRAAKVQLGRARIPAFVVASLIALLSLGAPLAAIIDWSVRGLAQGRTLTIDTGEVARVTWHTLAVSAVAALATVLLVLPIAVLYGRYRSRIGAVGNAVAISTFALPGILVALAGTFFIRQTNWTFNTFHNTMVVLIFAYVVRFAALAMGTSLLAVLAVPDRMRDASQTLGATGFRRFVSVDLPLMAPGLLAAGGLVLLSVMKELPISLLLSPFEFETLSTRIFSTFNESFVTEAGLMALALVGLSFVATWFLVIRPSER
ncbi:MAG: iron(III) transport system permease protein [Verrucomicrobiales bacterium]|jgi:iron(III) transport system permease protein